MANMALLRKLNTNVTESTVWLKSSPNLLENCSIDEFEINMMETKHTTSKALPNRSNTLTKSPVFSETLEQNAFMRNVINTKPNTSGNSYNRRYSSPSEKEATVRRSLEEISKDLKEIDDFLTKTEHIMNEEKNRDTLLEQLKCKRLLSNKENKSPSFITIGNSSSNSNSVSTNFLKPARITYKINSYKNCRRSKPTAPRFYYSRLYFRNGRIGCIEADKQSNNIQSTHALVKHILRFEHEKPLVSPESVRRVLNEKSTQEPANMRKFINNIEMVPLPGEILEETKDMPNEIERILLSTTSTVAVEEAMQSRTINKMFDEDEQDVRICYNELVNFQNEEKNATPIHLTKENSIDTAVKTNDNDNRLSSLGSLDSDGQQFLRDQVRHLVRRFTARANKVRTHLEMPPTPSSSSSSPSPPPPPPLPLTNTANSIHSLTDKRKLVMPQQSPNRRRLFEADTPRSNVWLCTNFCGSNNDERTLDPQGKIYITWLCVVSLSFLYNAWVIPLRSAFPFQTKKNTNIWLICDFCADIIYLLDVIFFKHRLMYLFEGFWVKNKNLTCKNYMRKLQFKLDLLALLPLELLYFKFGTDAVYLRFPRFFKIQSFWEVFRLLDRVISSPHIIRVAKTLTYMLYMIHITATLYYAYSKFQGLGVNRWVFSGKGHSYVRCFAFATKTATSIGKNPKPESEGEYVFMTVAWLMGVFVFALLIGQIRDIISTATRNRNEYRQLEDETLEYMRRLNLPQDVQKRVKMWFKFTWDQQRTLDESNILDSLPINLKTDIAISVHIQTLSKVQLFADCEEALLRDLVLKLRAVTFLPGDFVCRKGEVGREMYIVKLGQVQVMGGPNNDVVLATLTEGSVFGEISLLGINGADRRTADVCSKGYSNIFVLSKSDLNEVIAYYPNAQAILKKRARQLMRKNAAREQEEARERARSAMKADVVIGNPKTPEIPPRLLQTVIQALPYESPAVMLITRGSKRMRKSQRTTLKDTIEDKDIEDTSVQAIQIENKLRLDERHSPDLLSSIQNELKSKHKFINLTDSEKALIITSSSNSIDRIPENEMIH